jgi:hypothetical protein
MRAATAYPEWRALARELDLVDPSRLGGRGAVSEGKLYDARLLNRKLTHLRHMREGGNAREMMFNLRSELIRNVANLAKRCGLVSGGWTRWFRAGSGGARAAAPGPAAAAGTAAIASGRAGEAPQRLLLALAADLLIPAPPLQPSA